MNIAMIQVLTMFGIAFGISMFVALIIKILHIAITSKSLSRFYKKDEMAKYLRAKRIYNIRTRKIMNSIRVTETFGDNELLNYYYEGKSLLKSA